MAAKERQKQIKEVVSVRGKEGLEWGGKGGASKESSGSSAGACGGGGSVKERQKQIEVVSQGLGWG